MKDDFRGKTNLFQVLWDKEFSGEAAKLGIGKLIKYCYDLRPSGIGPIKCYAYYYLVEGMRRGVSQRTLIEGVRSVAAWAGTKMEFLNELGNNKDKYRYIKKHLDLMYAEFLDKVSPKPLAFSSAKTEVQSSEDEKSDDDEESDGDESEPPSPPPAKVKQERRKKQSTKASKTSKGSKTDLNESKEKVKNEQVSTPDLVSFPPEQRMDARQEPPNPWANLGQMQPMGPNWGVLTEEERVFMQETKTNMLKAQALWAKANSR
jgi:hypothetical protein